MSTQRENWPTIVAQISSGLEQFRTAWYDICTATVRDAASQPEAEACVRVSRTAMGGEAEVAIKAFQLLEVTHMLAGKRYIRPEDGRDFATQLYAQVCGDQFSAVMERARHYDDQACDEVQKKYRFTSDVARYITGDEAPVMVAVLLTRSAYSLMGTTQLVVANSFGDEQEASRTEAALHKWNSGDATA